MSKTALLFGCAIALVASSFATSPVRAADEKPVAGAPGTRFFEMRKYTAAPGKLDALLARFRDHTNALFEKHGITIIGYWVPTDGERSKDTLIYILAYPSREAREKSWKDFQADPDWQAARKESEKDGPLLIKAGVESTYMSPTDFSPIK
jgi:hypothetical protein